MVKGEIERKKMAFLERCQSGQWSIATGPKKGTEVLSKKQGWTRLWIKKSTIIMGTQKKTAITIVGEQ